MEACIKLVNVAKASLKELQEDYEDYLRNHITLANIALVLIHQTDYLLRKLLEKFKADFLTNGGIKEQMSAARRNWREEHGMGYSVAHPPR